MISKVILNQLLSIQEAVGFWGSREGKAMATKRDGFYNNNCYLLWFRLKVKVESHAQIFWKLNISIAMFKTAISWQQLSPSTVKTWRHNNHRFRLRALMLSSHRNWTDLSISLHKQFFSEVLRTQEAVMHEYMNYMEVCREVRGGVRGGWRDWSCGLDL